MPARRRHRRQRNNWCEREAVRPWRQESSA
jgi:hypothetical protein